MVISGHEHPPTLNPKPTPNPQPFTPTLTCRWSSRAMKRPPQPSALNPAPNPKTDLQMLVSGHERSLGRQLTAEEEHDCRTLACEWRATYKLLSITACRAFGTNTFQLCCCSCCCWLLPPLGSHWPCTR